MPNILALDCSTANCSVALAATDSEDLADIADLEANSHQLSRERRKSHHRLILPMIERLLHQAQVVKADLHSIICNIGPGSFVGLRIAVGVAQGISHANSLKVSGISSLEVAAINLLGEKQKLLGQETIGILSMRDGKVGESYWAYYSSDNNDSSIPPKIKQVIPPTLSKLSDIAKKIPTTHPMLISGGAKANVDTVVADTEDKVKIIATEYARQTSAINLLKAAAVKQANDSLDFMDPAQLNPLYVSSM